LYYSRNIILVEGGDGGNCGILTGHGLGRKGKGGKEGGKGGRICCLTFFVGCQAAAWGGPARVLISEGGFRGEEKGRGRKN